MKKTTTLDLEYLANDIIDIIMHAYEMKNNLCLFERPFKIQKNGVFRFEISFFVLEIFTFFYYANKIGDDIILFATK